MNKFYIKLTGSMVMIFAIVTIALSINAAIPGKKKKERPLYVPGEVIVKFRDGLPSTGARGSISSRSDSVIKDLDRATYHVRIPDSDTVESAVKSYNDNPAVEYAQPNYYHYAQTATNDPNYGDLWWVKNTGQTIAGADYTTDNPGTAGMDMDLESAWGLFNDCSSVTVAVVDSGINYNHEDITGNMWDGTAGCLNQTGGSVPGGCPHGGWNFIAGSNDPMDDNGHGTHVAGIIGASGNNLKGGSGICWKSKLMAVKAIDSTGAGNTVTIVNSINFAVKNGAKVINMSIGGYSFDPLEYNAIKSARDSGVLVVVAAGNDSYELAASGNNTTFPCQYDKDYVDSGTTYTALDNIVCIAALDQSYKLAHFSNWSGTYVHVGAPGANIKSTWYASQITTSDDFLSGWNSTGGWNAITCALTSGSINMLVNPAGWCSSPPYPTYSSNAQDTAYKTFNLAGFNKIILSFYAFVDTEPNIDYLYIKYITSGVNPYPSGTPVDQLSGLSNGYFNYNEYDITGCSSPTCSIGFTLKTNGTNNYEGISIIDFSITGVTTGNTGYLIENGTSMASPMAAGNAAMVWAYNPSFTYREVKNSVINGGDSVAALAGMVITSKAIDAFGSIKYINPPTGITAVVK